MSNNVKIWDLVVTLHGRISWEACPDVNLQKSCFKLGSYVCEADTIFQSRTYATSCARLLELVTGTEHAVDDVYPKESQGQFKEMVHTHLCDHRVRSLNRPMSILAYLANYTRFSLTEPPGLMAGLLAFFNFDPYWARRSVVSKVTGAMPTYLAKLE